MSVVQNNKGTSEMTDRDDLMALAEHAVGHAMTTLAFNSSTRAERRSIAEAVLKVYQGWQTTQMTRLFNPVTTRSAP